MNLFRTIFLAFTIVAVLGVSYVAYRGAAPDTSGRQVSLRTGSGGNSGFFGFGRVK
ncbi:hypothetical protein [Nioella sediminis]|jgi:hypothetical protein|uniref:hypothetical protein n=1 Tax=Nioella sediminis TaxID=1912092 RepID=UPI000A4695A8|nr:hypothetical protein [Nioella sediminis]